MDASDAAHYFELLDQLPLRRKLDAETTHRARKYAYHFFFRRMIPVDCIEQLHGKKSLFQINAKSLDDLRAGTSRGLDIICNGILRGSDFIYPAEDGGHTSGMSQATDVSPGVRQTGHLSSVPG